MAEALVNYYPKGSVKASLRGNHSRNAYQDILDIDLTDHGQILADISRPGLYDTLPETLFHPIDRFDKIPPNEYKERFAEECEKQQKEEENARRFFEPFDSCLFHLSCEVDKCKLLNFSSVEVLSDIVCDNKGNLPSANSFIAKALPFVAECRRMRGDYTLITLMLRRILNEEGITLVATSPEDTFTDPQPRYNSTLDGDNDVVYLGNEFPERVTTYTLRYWDDDTCDDRFHILLKDLEEFRQFLNRYFVGIEERIDFDISTLQEETTLDDSRYHYLNHNSNL